MTAVLRPTQTFVARDLPDFQALTSASFVPLDVTAGDPAAFRGWVASNGADGVQLTDISASPHVVTRTPELIAAADRHYYKLTSMLSGTGLLIQNGREVTMRPGDIALYDTQHPYSLVFEGEYRGLVVMFAHERVDLPPNVVGQLTAVEMSGQQGLGAIVVPYLRELGTHLDQLGSPAGVQLAHTALNLLSTMFANELGLRRGESDPHALMLERLRGYIRDHLAAPDLAPAQIAAANYISTRYLHKLFREQGTTVSQWIRSLRLEHARRDLLDPAYRALPVAAIGARWGLYDAPHFSRIFKAAFGHSPSELRGG